MGGQKGHKKQPVIKFQKKDNKEVNKGVIILNLVFSLSLAVSYIASVIGVMIYNLNETKVFKLGLGFNLIVLITYLIVSRVFIKKYGVNKK
ncbi:MAG: hypothetical protein ACRCTZ_05225 [Sarcina sp.]